MVEIWAPIPGHPYYEASDKGRIRSLDRTDRFGRLFRGRVLVPHKNRGGYLYVNLYGDGRAVKGAVHRLVLTAFVGPCPEGMECCHNDGNQANNAIENLRWGSSKENKRDIKRHGNYRNPSSIKTHCTRGHALQVPNLMPSQMRKGHRICLACNRAKAIARYRGIPVTRSLTDRYYAEIMSEARRG